MSAALDLSRASAVPPDDRRLRVAADLDRLHAVRRRGVALALWPRSLPAGIGGRALDSFASVPRLDARGTPAQAAAAIAGRLPSGPATARLAADIAGLAGLAGAFARIAAAPTVAIRLESVAGDGCPVFHADAVRLRLVTTYRGRGTQWLPAALAAVRGATPPETDPREMAPGTVAVFRGAPSPEALADALVHRSPPRRAGDADRLFLAIDPGA